MYRGDDYRKRRAVAFSKAPELAARVAYLTWILLLLLVYLPLRISSFEPDFSHDGVQLEPSSAMTSELPLDRLERSVWVWIYLRTLCHWWFNLGIALLQFLLSSHCVECLISEKTKRLWLFDICTHFVNAAILTLEVLCIRDLLVM